MIIDTVRQICFDETMERFSDTDDITRHATTVELMGIVESLESYCGTRFTSEELTLSNFGTIARISRFIEQMNRKVA